MDELIEDQEHEIYCGCNGGWYGTIKEYPNSLCIIDSDGKCMYCGCEDGVIKHTLKCMMILFPDHDSLTEKRRRSVPDDAVVEGAGMATRKTCPKCRHAYIILVEFEHGDAMQHTQFGLVPKMSRASGILDPEIALKAMAEGKLKEKKRDGRPTEHPIRAERWR
jgi:hypothetical protein